MQKRRKHQLEGVRYFLHRQSSWSPAGRAGNSLFWATPLWGHPFRGWWWRNDENGRASEIPEFSLCDCPSWPRRWLWNRFWSQAARASELAGKETMPAIVRPGRWCSHYFDGWCEFAEGSICRVKEHLLIRWSWMRLNIKVNAPI